MLQYFFAIKSIKKSEYCIGKKQQTAMSLREMIKLNLDIILMLYFLFLFCVLVFASTIKKMYVSLEANSRKKYNTELLYYQEH